MGGPSDLFASRTGSGSFDASMAFEMAAELTLASIFNRQRIERIMQQSFRNDSLPGLLDVVELISQKIILEVLQDVFLLTNASFNNQSIYLGLQLEATTVQICLANHLINLASISASSSVAVSSLMLFHVSSLKAWISEWNQAVNNFYLADNSASTVRLSIKRKRSVQFWIAHSAKLFGMLDNLQPVDGFANFGVFPMGPPL